MLTDTGQALVKDRNQGTYVVVRVGDTVQGFRVTSIQHDQIVLSRDRQHYIIPLTKRTAAQPKPVPLIKTLTTPAPNAAPATSTPVPAAPIVAAKTTPAKTATAAPTTPAPPTAPAAATTTPAPSSAPVPKTAEPAPKTTQPTPATATTTPEPSPPIITTAPPVAPAARAKPTKLELINPYPKPKMKIVIAPPGLRFDPRDAATKAELDEKRVTTVNPTVVAPTGSNVQLRDQSLTVQRSEFDTAVADFTALAKEVQFRRAGKHVEVMGISRGSYFYRLGLRKGDHILDVDGTAVASLDDAATVYARLMAANAFAVRVQRGKQLITFRYSFAK